MPRRGKGGRFVKSGSVAPYRRTRGASRRSTVVVRQSPSRPVVIRTDGRVRRRVSRRAFSGGTGRMPLRVKGELGLWGSLMGYLSVNKADMYSQIPTTGKLPREVVIGLIGHWAGRRNKNIDRAAAAALAIGGFKLGEQGFKISGWDGDDD